MVARHSVAGYRRSGRLPQPQAPLDIHLQLALALLVEPLDRLDDLARLIEQDQRRILMDVELLENRTGASPASGKQDRIPHADARPHTPDSSLLLLKGALLIGDAHDVEAVLAILTVQFNEEGQ